MKTEIQFGLFNRVIQLFELIVKIPDDVSDEEVEGLFALLPSDTREALIGFFEPNIRTVSISFFKMIAKWMFDARAAHDKGKKVVLVPFNFPPELVLAFDNAEVLTTEVMTTLGAVALEGKGEPYWDVQMSLGLPDHICSSNSIELGSMLSGEDFNPDAIISAAPGGCDVNSKIHEFVSNYMEIPQFIIEKTVDDTPEGKEQYKLYFNVLISQLEEFLGEKLTEDKLRTILTGANRCTELYWELWELHKARPCPVPNMYSLFLAPARFCMWGTPECISVMEKMVQVAKERYEKGAYEGETEVARCLWAYTSYYFNPTQLFTWMGKRGYTHLADVLNLYMPRPIDTTSMDTMIDGMIQAAWDYPMTRQMGSQSMSKAWIEDMIHVSKELKADCIIYCGHDACKQTWSVISILREEMMKRAGIPVLVLHGDSWRKTTTPITVLQKNIEEFIVNMVEKKSGKRRKVRKHKKKSKKTAIAE